MLTRFVRIQLAIFSIASIIGMLVLVFAYIQAADVARYRPHHRHPGIARNRRTLSVLQRDIPGLPRSARSPTCTRLPPAQ